MVLRRAIYIYIYIYILIYPPPPPWICGIPLGLLGDKSESARAAVSRVQTRDEGRRWRGKKGDTGCAREDGRKGGGRGTLYPLRSAFPRSCRTRRPVIVITGETFREKAHPFVLFLFSFLFSFFFFLYVPFREDSHENSSGNCENSRRGCERQNWRN